MKTSVTCRHEAIGAAAREYVKGKVEKLNRYFDNLQKIEVILDGARDHRFSAELIVSAPRGNIIVCHAGGSSATAAFDEAIEKMERQLKKLKQRMRSRSATRRTRRNPASMLREDNTGDLWW